MTMKLLTRYEGYELIIPANTTASQVNFPDIPELRSDGAQETVVMSIEVFPTGAVPATYSNNTNATEAQVANAFLTLYILGFQQHYRVPLQKYVSIRSNTASYYFEGEPFFCRPVQIDWTKSYVSFAVAPINNAQYSYMFLFGYEWLPVGAYAKYVTNYKAQLANGIIPIA